MVVVLVVCVVEVVEVVVVSKIVVVVVYGIFVVKVEVSFLVVDLVVVPLGITVSENTELLSEVVTLFLMTSVETVKL